MIACGRCQTQNLDGSQFCDECGAALLPAATTANRSSDSLESSQTNAFRLPPLETDEATLVRPDKPVPATPPPVPLPLAVEPLPPPPPAASSPRQQITSAVSGLGIPELAAVAPPAPANSPALTAKLVIERGRAAGKQFPLHNEEAYIGRWDADGGIFPDVDLDADDPEAKVSRRHARIVRQSGQYYVEDLGSTNGTFINRGRRLLPGDRHPLNDGDELIIGKMFMRFYVVRN
jgi:FHA domain